MINYDKDINNLESLFKENYHFLCLVSLSILRDDASSKDVVQDFFIYYWKNRDRISLQVSFKSYAVKSVKNLSFQLLRKIEKENAVLREIHLLEREDFLIPVKARDNKKLHDLVNQLPEKRRKIFLSYVINGESYSEIAKNNKISLNTVKTQMKRAYHFLKTEAAKDLSYFLLVCVHLFL